MPFLDPPLSPTPRNARHNHRFYAKEFLDRDGAMVVGKRASGRRRCSACNRCPESKTLCEIIFDPHSNLMARVGVGVCHFRFFRAELEELLRQELAGNHPNKVQRMSKLRDAIRKLPRKL